MSAGVFVLWQVMFLQRKGQVIMTIELLDTEETQTEDPVEVQVISPGPLQGRGGGLQMWMPSGSLQEAKQFIPLPLSPTPASPPALGKLRGAVRGGGGCRERPERRLHAETRLPAKVSA